MVVSSRLRRKSAIMLLVTGSLLVLVAFLAAFTIFGEAAGVVGLACLGGSALLLSGSRT